MADIAFITVPFALAIFRNDARMVDRRRTKHAGGERVEVGAQRIVQRRVLAVVGVHRDARVDALRRALSARLARLGDAEREQVRLAAVLGMVDRLVAAAVHGEPRAPQHAHQRRPCTLHSVALARVRETWHVDWRSRADGGRAHAPRE